MERDGCQPAAGTEAAIGGGFALAAGLTGDAGEILTEAATAAAWACGTAVAVCVLLMRGPVRFYAARGVPPPEARRCGLLALASALEESPVAFPDASAEPGLAASPLLTHPTPVGLFVCVPVAIGTGPPLGAVAVLDHVPRIEARDMLPALNRIAGRLASRLESEHCRTRGAERGEGGTCAN